MVGAMKPVRLVLVDDHEMVIEGLKAMLAAFGDRVEVVGQAVGAERALGVIEQLDPDIVLCDVRMQGSSGLDLCSDLRDRQKDRKVVMLSVYDDEQYLFQALRVGASGYLLKSISSDELVRQLEFVYRGETAIELTPREFSLLEFLMRRAGDAVSKADILHHVWDANYDGDANVVEVYVGYLRRKIDTPFGLQSLQTVRGAGYRLTSSVGAFSGE